MSRRPNTEFAGYAAAAAAAVMIANQVGSKATRDTLFLSNFDIDALPLMLMGAAAFSIITLLWASRLMAVWTPARMIPITFGLSGLLLVGEWALWFESPKATSVILYLHVAALGSFLISGFWSIINERFDPRTVKKKVGLIASGGTLGGLMGGLLAERVAAWFTVATMLPLLASMHLACGLILYLARSPSDPRSRERKHRPVETKVSGSGLKILAGSPYLRNIGLLVLTTTAGATLLDYVFKARALDAYGQGEDLMRFFAVFYAAVGLGTFVLQTTLSRSLLEKLGLARTIAILPSFTALGSFALLFVPGLAAAGVARGGEAAVRSSLFRSGYELLYTPVTLRQKRTAKSMIDVGVDRLADGVGAILIRSLLFLVPALALEYMLGIAMLLTASSLFIASKIQQGYVDALKNRLVHRAEELDIPELNASAADSAVMQTLGNLDLSRVILGQKHRETARPVRPNPSSTFRKLSPEPADEIVGATTDLRSGDPTRVRARLKGGKLDPLLAGQVISLLAWNAVSDDSLGALRRIATKIVGELTDALADPERDFAIRRRVARVMAECDSQRGVDGLLMGLEDKRFEVRYQSAAALGHIREGRSDLAYSKDRIIAAVLAELRVDQLGWRSRRLVDSDDSGQMDQLLKDRANLSLDHVFRLLSLFLEKEPLKIALQGLHTDDLQLRGTALEYLESVLPAQIRERLWPFLEGRKARKVVPHQARDALSELLQSRKSIETNLAGLKKR